MTCVKRGLSIALISILPPSGECSIQFLITFPNASAVHSTSRVSFSSAGTSFLIVCIFNSAAISRGRIAFSTTSFRYTSCSFRVIVPASNLDIFKSVAINHSIFDKSIACLRINSYLSSSVSSSLQREAFRIFNDVKGVFN